MIISMTRNNLMIRRAFASGLGLLAGCLVAALALPHAAQAEPSRKLDLWTAKQNSGASTPKQTARPRSSSCSEFGAGFVRMPDSDTCVRLGGGMDVGVGGSR